MRPLRLLLALGSLVTLAGCAAARPRGASTAARERTVTLMFMADAHGDIETHPELFWRPDGSTELAPAGGYARLAGAANAIRRETGGRALLVDGGDTFQGSAVAAWSRGEAIVGPHRALGVLSGDSHERVTEPIERNGAVIVEPGSFASFLGRLDVRLRPGELPAFAWHLLELRADRYPEDARVRAAVDAAVAPYRARLDRVLGRTSVALERYGVVENSADDVLTSAIRSATGVEVALSNGFRFAHPIPVGPVTEGDLWRLYPVVTRLKVGTVTGRQLRDFWESEIDHVFADDARRLFGGWLPRVSGMTVRFRASAPAGRRVTELRVGGDPVEDGRRYSIAACEREGDVVDALCRMRGVADARVLEVSVHDVVREWLARQPSVGGPSEHRVVADDLPPRVFSQYYRR